MQLSAVPKHPLQLALQAVHLKVELLTKLPLTHEVHLKGEPEQVKQFALHRAHLPMPASKKRRGLQHVLVDDVLKQTPFDTHILLAQEVQLLAEPEHVKQLALHS